MRRDRELAFQATLQVEPADKRLSVVLRIGLVIGPSLIERFDSDEASKLLSRKTNLLELPNVRHSWELLSEFHGQPPVSLSCLVRAVRLPGSVSSSRMCISQFSLDRLLTFAAYALLHNLKNSCGDDWVLRAMDISSQAGLRGVFRLINLLQSFSKI